MLDHLNRIITSKEFKKDLQDYTLYVAHFKLERLISHSHTKFISQAKIHTFLEEKKVDIVANAKKIEVKYPLEFDSTEKPNRELKALELLTMRQLVDAGINKAHI